MRKIAVFDNFTEPKHREQINAAAARCGFTVDYYPAPMLAPADKCCEYEVLYGMPAIESILEDMDRIMERSQLMTPQRMAERPYWRRVLGTMLRLFAMWM